MIPTQSAGHDGPNFHLQINTYNRLDATMPSSSSPTPSPPPPSLSLNSRLNSPATAFPRLVLGTGLHSPSLDLPPPASPSIPFSPTHATNKFTGSGVHGRPISPISDHTTIASTARARRATVSDTVASSSTSAYVDDIEMDPINPTGHRRRRSSLMSPSASATPQQARNGHTRGPSAVSGQFVMDEPKISEESEATIKGKDGVIRGLPHDYVSDEDLHDDEETGLTAKERKRKQKKKKRNTMLDQRIARDNITAEEKKEADQNVVRILAVNGTLIGLWYLFSLCISLVSRAIKSKSQPYRILTRRIVQQVDVRHPTTQFPLPPFHDVCTHACAIYPRRYSSLLCAVSETSECTTTQVRSGPYEGRLGTRATTYDQDVLPHENRTLRCRHRSRYWLGEYFPQVHHPDILQ